MNFGNSTTAIVNHLFRFWLYVRRQLPRHKCQAFGGKSGFSIEKIYVINLDRAEGRWSRLVPELRRVLDSSGAELLSLTSKHSAVDANAFTQEPHKDANVDPCYTLKDQLFVEPQPLVMPTRLDLDGPIRMSRPEIAVARSHIDVWRLAAASDHTYTLILEDDVWFHNSFVKRFDQAWNEISARSSGEFRFDILYISYLEVKGGAPKTFISDHVFRPDRGLWHLSGYVLSREGAKKLLGLLPCRGPVDLWLNHQFNVLNVLATNQSLINQRRDGTSTNSYSILPSLTKIGAITSEKASLLQLRPTEHPVFAFGPEGSGLSSLAMALSMLGYRCCSDVKVLPDRELERLLKGKSDRIFNAYVNIGSLNESVSELRRLYPKAKYLITTDNSGAVDHDLQEVQRELGDCDTTVLPLNESKKWQVLCEHLRCAPPACSFPLLNDLGQRPPVNEGVKPAQFRKFKRDKCDESPWVVEELDWWNGLHTRLIEPDGSARIPPVKIKDDLKHLDLRHWLLRSDTFTDNLAMFRPSNVEFDPIVGATLFVKKEALHVRDYSGAAICSREQYLFGRFEARIRASNVPGVVTGFFLHRNSPRQEIDIEIAGNRPNQLLTNVFYNPGDDGACFDYGYRGSPYSIDLGFDASQSAHTFAIEWSPCEIRWFVDDRLVHRRVIWDPTPIPHLPMTLHVNSWLSRSVELAGRVNKRQLPATTNVKFLALEASPVISSLGPYRSSESARH